MASIDFATTILLIKSRKSEPIFKLVHNHSFWVHEEDNEKECPPLKGREGTPHIIANPTTWLVLTTSRKPFDPLRGWVFGSNDELCDVLLDHDNGNCVSGKHFCIDYDWTSRCLTLTNLSKQGYTTVNSYSIGLRDKRLSGNSSWIIRTDEQTTIMAGDSCSITVEIPRRGKYQRDFEENLEVYHREVQDAVPQVGRLRFDGTTTETPLVASRQNPKQYTLQEEIGRGAYGTVFKAYECSTKKVYAAKVYPARQPLELMPVELKILQKVSHDHIVAFVDLVTDPEPILVMEYIMGGNLAQLRSPSEDEAILVIKQQLSAINYLHSMGVTHRDIKPANILIFKRRPHLETKLADFGLSSDRTVLMTYCGTCKYAAPEIRALNSEVPKIRKRKCRSKNTEDNQRYTNAVDLWSLGVVGLELLAGLPSWNKILWIQRIRQQVSGYAGLLSVLLNDMLQIDPAMRPSADECILKADCQSSTISLSSTTSKRNLSTIHEEPPETSSSRKRTNRRDYEFRFSGFF